MEVRHKLLKDVFEYIDSWGSQEEILFSKCNRKPHVCNGI
jgi:hypothetical protein